MTDRYDELERLLADYGSGHEHDGHGGCVLCSVYVPHTDDEQIRVRYPCAFAALPDLLAERRRLREALERFLDTPYPNNGEGRADLLVWSIPESAFGPLRQALAEAQPEEAER